MKYYLIAGEASGDLHGANLMKSLKVKDPEAAFRFYGGDLMKAQGGALVKHYREMAFMGFTEVLLNLRTVLLNLKRCKEDVLTYQPDVLVLVDFPGFNLNVAKFAHQQGFKIAYYISPKVWAWNQKRVLKIKKIVDRMFCILPFEVEFYRTWGMEVDYVGNPLLDAKAQFNANPAFRQQNGLSEKPVIALLPGSRKQEIERLLPDMLSVSERFPDYQFVVAAAPSFDLSYYDQFVAGKDVKLVFGSTYDLLNIASAALVASGTATLETALFHVPQVVLYRGGRLSIALARMLVKIEYISLVNLIMKKKVVTELIQEDCRTDRIGGELQLILEGKERAEMERDYDSLDVLMGSPGASERTAELILQYFGNKM